MTLRIYFIACPGCGRELICRDRDGTGLVILDCPTCRKKWEARPAPGGWRVEAKPLRPN